MVIVVLVYMDLEEAGKTNTNGEGVPGEKERWGFPG